MNLHHKTNPPTPRRSFAFTSLRSLALALGLAAFVSLTSAAEPPPSAAAGFSDVVLARSALIAIDSDAGLKGVNLVVSVVDGVAVIGGPVPSTAIAERAEQVVRKVKGMKDVRNTCFVSSGPDPLLKAVADRAGSALPPRPVPGELPGVLSNQLSPPVSPFPPNTIAAADPNSTVVALKPPLTGPGTGSILGAPVGPAGNATVPGPSSAPTTAPGQLTGSSSGGVLAAVNEVKRAEARFGSLTVELRDGGVLLVGGSAPRASDAWDFAKKLQQVPGVSRVAVGAVKGK